MAGLVSKLEPGDVLEPGAHFAGPWQSFERILLERGLRCEFSGDAAEYAIVVMRGSGRARIGRREEAITPGASLVVGYRAAVELHADDEMELFVTTLRAGPGGTPSR
jgi:hypothetical protein